MVNDKKFWKIVYLYTTKYNNDILYYRPEKQDIWLINSENEITRLIYNEKIDNAIVDSDIYNIIKNEKRLKNFFKLSSLRIKILHFSQEGDKVQEYKKYKVSNDLLIERVIISQKNIEKFIRKEDIKFIDILVDSDRYKKRVVERYKNKNIKNKSINFHFNFIAIFFVLLFLLNYIGLYYNNSFSIYNFLEYNYQKIVSGQFYRLITDIFIFQNATHLIIISLFILLCSYLLNEEIKLIHSIIVLFVLSLCCNLFLLFNQVQSIVTINLAFLGLLGSMFILELNRRNNNLKFVFTIVLPIVYIIVLNIFFDTDLSIGMYMFAFILGIFTQIFLFKKINVIMSTVIISIIIFAGFVISIFDIDLKSSITNYKLSSVNNRLLTVSQNTSTEYLESEINSNNKSILTYYELGMIKITTSSIQEAKKVFLEGINFDNKFAPIYYQLAIIELKENNKSKSLEYIEKAIELDRKNEYLEFRDEINSKG